MIKSYKDLKVYQISYSSAMEIFWLSKNFPRDESYSLNDQIRRASRSVTANIVEGWSRRQYENIFKRHLVDSIGSAAETKLWLDFALDCKYISSDVHLPLVEKYDELGRMLTSLCANWKTEQK